VLQERKDLVAGLCAELPVSTQHVAAKVWPMPWFMCRGSHHAATVIDVCRSTGLSRPGGVPVLFITAPLGAGPLTSAIGLARTAIRWQHFGQLLHHGVLRLHQSIHGAR
jgi:hypothetical protein